MNQFRDLDNFKKSYQPRSAWGAKYPRKWVPPRLGPAKYVFCGYYDRQWSNKNNLPPGILSLMADIQFRQYIDFTFGYPDIKANFMIAYNGKSYEGRGWNHIPGLSRPYARFSPDSVYITYIGNFEESPPPEDYYLMRDDIIELGVKTGYINKKFILWNISFPTTFKLNEFEKYLFIGT